ncbi:MAG: DPP IV N-terminal domain-containing protein [Bacillota bacterium]|jgi:dipeptidyl-peptidase-4
MGLLEAYQRAADIYNASIDKCVLNEKVDEHWIIGSEDFWYAKDIENDEKNTGTRYTRYCYAHNKEEPLFCHERLAELIAPRWIEKADPFKLPIKIVEVDDESGLIYFFIDEAVGEFVYSIKEQTVSLLRFAIHEKSEVVSPDKAYSVFVRGHNIFCRDNNTGKVTQMTFDGEENLEYGLWLRSPSTKYLEDNPTVRSPGIIWSPDSDHFITYRSDARLVGKFHLVQSAPKNGQARPIGISYPYALPGDEHVFEGQLYVGSVKGKTVTKVLADDQPVTLFLLSMFDGESKQVKWTEDGRFAYLLRYDRFFKKPQCVIVDAETNTARVAFEETYDTFGFTEDFGTASQESYSEPGLRYLPGTEEIIWLSEIEGWAALYLYDAHTGQLKLKLTDGEWVARRIKYVDEENRMLYFTGSGLEHGVDPYYQFLYSVNLDTKELRRISEEKAEHFVRFSPKGNYYVDTFSTVNSVPRTVIRDRNGHGLLQIATADISRILQKGFIFPEPFTAIGRDQKTRIFGIIIKPYGFDPEKKYPVIDYIYGGSQRINTPKAFEFAAMKKSGLDPFGGLQSLAQLGFVGIIVDGFATPLRSKNMHDYVYGKPEECCGLQEHVLAIKQLAEQYPWIDADRVGIWGFSGGGYAAARALLEFPEFFKVGVSCAGNHDQAKYHAHWAERWIGKYSDERYKGQANHSLADRLQGHLLLIHGDMDDNVHPSGSMKLIEALIEANRDFDFLLFPNSAHGVIRFPYVVRRKWDYFVRHLMGLEPPHNFVIRQPEDKKDK